MRALFGHLVRRVKGVAEPPGIGKEFPLLVPQVDAAGNELAGVRLPDVAVSLATYTGWNPFHPSFGPPQELASMVGSDSPSPRTRQEARARGDRRTPIHDRYRSREDYQQRREDIPGIVERGGRQRDWVTSQP